MSSADSPDPFSDLSELPPGLVSHGVDAAEIARRSKSNLAFALACLPAERRRAMITFYAFCRIVDDIADEPGMSLKERRILLAAWRRIVRGDQAPVDAVSADIAALPSVYGFSSAWLEEIIDGVSMDLELVRYPTYDSLLGYCYKVASVVGLVSLRLFGVKDQVADDYAVQLGYALQMTNILRDVKADWDNDRRIYLPAEDMARFGYTEADIASHRYNDAFAALMSFEGQRAFRFYENAIAARPASELGKLQAAEAMRKIYHLILVKMQRDGWKAYGPRYRATRWEKGSIVAWAWLRGWCR